MSNDARPLGDSIATKGLNRLPSSPPTALDFHRYIFSDRLRGQRKGAEGEQITALLPFGPLDQLQQCYPVLNHARDSHFSLPQAAADGYKETGLEKVPQAKGYRAGPGTGSGLSWSVSRPTRTAPIRYDGRQPSRQRSLR